MIDISCWPDLDVNFRPIEGARVVTESVQRRLSTVPGSLRFHPAYGIDLASFINDTIGPETAFEIRSGIDDQLQQDDRILRANSQVAFNYSTRTMVVQIEALTATGPFELTIDVRDLKPSMLGP